MRNNSRLENLANQSDILAERLWDFLAKSGEELLEAIMSLVAIAFRILVVTYSWNWFVVPRFGAPNLDPITVLVVYTLVDAILRPLTIHGHGSHLRWSIIRFARATIALAAIVVCAAQAMGYATPPIGRFWPW